jgi:hypothetical protein
MFDVTLGTIRGQYYAWAEKSTTAYAGASADKRVVQGLDPVTDG